ncbi:hypothetical protein GAYE_SCF06G2804 [Galdieria yellowstonensis]|uniref:HIT-type domain-containing protein n=1 Tax=Galdieria yellowstonensis TaxID=3028027 RepID=A0AAV9IC26_9RHOD|nr:hypothetical protein GAYE_SCF06G2804 [Galdieria yellowstonensis]
MTATDAICVVCQKPAKYKTPTTQVSYCSVACYRQLPRSEKKVELNSKRESGFDASFSTTYESSQSVTWEADEEKEEQFRQLAQTPAIQELLQDRFFCQELQNIVTSTNPLERLQQMRTHHKFAQFEQAVFQFFHITDDQV